MEDKQGQSKDMKRLPSLNIVSGKSAHKGYGAGSIDLSQLSSVIIDDKSAYFDLGALHAKSSVERGIRFSPHKEEVPAGRNLRIVWVAADFNEAGEKYYAGVTACEMIIDEQAKKGWKVLADHVTRMDYALKRRIMVENLSSQQKAWLKQLLAEKNPQMWAFSSDELKEALSS